MPEPFTRAGDRAKCRAQAAAMRAPAPTRRSTQRVRPRRSLRGLVLASTVLLAASSGLTASAQAQTPPTDPPVTNPPTTAPTTAPTTVPTTAPTTVAPTTTTRPPNVSTTTTTTTTPDESTTTTTGPSTTTTSTPGDMPTFTEIGEIPPEALDLLNRYRELEQGAAALLTQLQMLNGGIAAKQDELLAVQKRLDDAEHRLIDTNEQLIRTEDELDAQYAVLRTRAIAAYIDGPSTFSSGVALLKATSVDDVEKSIAYGGAIVADEKAIIGRTTTLKGRVASLHRQAETEHAEAQRAQDELVAERTDLEKQRDAIISAEEGLQKNAKERLDLLSEAAKRQLMVEAGFAKVESVRDGIAQTLAARQKDQLPPPATLGIFLSPVANPKINQPFGASYDPLFQVSRGHPGIDINGTTGDPLRASADGVVVASGWLDGYGNCIIIDHGNALATLYAHQSVLVAKEGEQVRRGQVIGLLGSTGYSTGPHLHWEVRVRGNVVDPAPFIGETR